MSFKDLIIFLVFIFFMFMYYWALKNKPEMGLLVKITYLILTLVLAFIHQDYIIIGSMAFGGRLPVMTLIGIEIVDAITEWKKNRAEKS